MTPPSALPRDASAPPLNWDRITTHKKRHDFQLETNISLKNAYVYLQVCKGGSSTVRHHLQTLEYRGTPYKVKDVNNRHVSPHLWPFQLTDEHLFDLLTSPDVRRFTFVRNPFSRLLSAYLQRIDTPSPSRKSLGELMSVAEEAAIPFGDFVRFIVGQETVDMDMHWRPQIASVCYPEIDLDFVGRVETLGDDMRRLSHLLFGEQVFDDATLDRTRIAPKQTNAADRLRQYYTPELIDLVQTRYARDFEVFGYAPDLPA